MADVVLEGCTPFPLASYLKALGLIRLVGEQVDRHARGAWARERFVLSSSLGAEELVQFFLHEYRPSPVLSPWNGGSGFNKGPGDASARVLLEQMEGSRTPRLEPYRLAVAACRRARARLGLVEKPEGEEKSRLIALCRALFPEEALAWLDAAVILTQEGPAYPRLLGTGGNDGRLDFSANQMKRLCGLFDPATGMPGSATEGVLRSSLFGTPVQGLPQEAIGQFFPSAAGGANASTGFDGESQVNPWDFVLMLEGALLFTASASRRLQDQTSAHLSAPFTVRPVSGGYASAGLEDEGLSKAEIWLPLWEEPASLPELRQLFAEGRARVGTRLAATGLDFARAVSSLGVDRGVSSFQRVGFQERNGQSNFAISLGRFSVARNPQADLLDTLDQDGWLQRVANRVGDNHPASVRRRVHQLQGALFDLCRLPGRPAAQRALVAVGALHRSFALLPIRDEKDHPPPCPLLDPRWVSEADDGSAEFDAAAALAGLTVWAGGSPRRSLRALFDPVSTQWSRVAWDPEQQSEILRPPEDLERIAREALERLLVELQSRSSGDSRGADQAPGEPTHWRDEALRRVRMETLLAWLSGELDWRRAADLFWGLLLVRPEAPWGRAAEPDADDGRRPPGAYSLLKLCFAGRKIRRGAADPEGHPVPFDPDLLAGALSGQGDRAVRRAAQRLRSSLLPPALEEAWLPAVRSRRFAAAVLLPLDGRTVGRLAWHVLKNPEPTGV